jgi:membrane protease YdiL (CAAX protease family)
MSFWIEFFSFYYYRHRYQFRELNRSSIFGAVFVVLLFTFLFNSLIEVLPVERPSREFSDQTFSSLCLSSLIIIVVAPVLEELAFRLFLGKFDTLRFLVSASLAIAYILLFATGLLGAKNLDYVHSYALLLTCASFLFSVGYFSRNRVFRLEKFWNNHVILMIYINSIAFSIVHIRGQLHYDGVLNQILSIIPVFVLSLVASFIRIRFGFLLCVLFHSAVNMPSLLKLIIVHQYISK